MAGRKRCGRRVSNLGAAILVLAGLAQLRPVPPRTARAGERRQDIPMAPALAAAIRDADAQAVGKLIEAGGADPNAAGGGPVEAFEMARNEVPDDWSVS
jgi:hypothetical protein